MSETKQLILFIIIWIIAIILAVITGAKIGGTI